MLPRNILPRVQPLAATAAFLAFFTIHNLRAEGIYRDGVGAKSMSLGGADVAWADDPLTSLGDNPAGLGFMNSSMLTLGALSVLPEGSYSNRVDPYGSMSDHLTTGGEGALGVKLGDSPVRLGFGFFPEAGLEGNWTYSDVPGGTGGKTTYGLQPEKSDIILLRSTAGIGIQITSRLSFGASVGLDYNENRLETAYVFQGEPTLPPGFKTLLNLDASGLGVDGNVGLQYHATDTLLLGVVYKTETTVRAHGDAYGNASQQLNALGLGAAPPFFHYDAEVDNSFPQSVSAGATWKTTPKWTLSGQIDWIDWSTFGMLPVKLTNGSNPDINAVVGSSSLNDSIPLKWSDELVYRFGVEYQLNDNFALRAGYIYGRDPVPTSTLTPLTAAITENTFTTGIGYTQGRYSVDFAYQYSIPTTRTVATSGLLAGEYDDSSVRVSIQTFSLTASVKF